MTLLGGATAGAIVKMKATGAKTISDRWEIGPFKRPAGGQPILRPNPDAVFTDPNTHRLSHWEFAHAFNPAAIAWNDKLYVLFRAEGQHGDEIGGYTSRVGLAESADGRSFEVLPHPVVYPAPGKWGKCEWPGGCEDPRIVQSEDGTFVLTFTMWNHKVAAGRCHFQKFNSLDASWAGVSGSV